MKAFFEIVRLEWRALVRSRAFAMLSLAALAWMLILPRIVRDDGTAGGAFEIRVRYALGIVFSLVVVSLSAAAAGSLAKERAARRLQLALVKPVSRFALALGRTLALTAAGSLVLALSCAVLWFQTGAGRTCDHVLEPVLEPPEKVADRIFARYVEENENFKAFVERKGEGASRRYLVNHLEQVEDYEPIVSGGKGSWTFDISSIGPEDVVTVLARPMDSFGGREEVKGVFRLGSRTGRIAHVNGTQLRVPLAFDAAAPDASEGRRSAGELVFGNEGAKSVLIYPRQDLRLLVRADAFGWNLLRAWMELTSELAFVVAAAMLLGACLGRSVSVFTVISLLIVMVVSPGVIENYPDPTESSFVDRASLAMTEFAARATSPFNALSPIGSLEGGYCIEWSEVLRAVAEDAIVLPVLLALLSALVLSRRQDV